MSARGGTRDGSGVVLTAVRIATTGDIEACQRVARQHSKWLPFVRRDSLLRAVGKRELYVAESGGAVVGFVNWHARRDGWSTVYDLAVTRGYEGQGIGRALLYAVPCPIRLKCTADNPANVFYINAGMGLAATETAHSGRALNVYEMRILSIIVHGNNGNTPDVARTTGNAYGVKYQHKAHAWPYMVDSDPEQCDWSAVMQVVKEWHPAQVLTADYFPGQKEQMLSQVEDLRAAGVLRIAVCPKFYGAVKDIPPDCIVALSLKTNGKRSKGANKYAGFMPDFSEVRGRMVHLLGGSPRLQKDTICKLQAVGARILSVDGNAHLGSAGLGSTWEDGRWRRKVGSPVELLAGQMLSSANIQRELNAAATWQQPSLFGVL